MILMDTGPLVELFDPQENWHEPCRQKLKQLKGPDVTTPSVLKEAYCLLGVSSIGAQRLRDFVLDGGMQIHFLDNASLARCFEWMEKFAGQPMDLADASLVAAGEALETRRVFRLNRRDFGVNRLKRGHRSIEFELVLQCIKAWGQSSPGGRGR
jgi:predicted nucleic acid-binding protein